MKRILNAMVIVGLLFFGSQMVFSEETATTEVTPGIEEGAPTGGETEPQSASGSRFYDRELLAQTLLAGLPSEEPDGQNPEGEQGETTGTAPGTGDGAGGSEPVAGNDPGAGTGDEQPAGSDSGTGTGDDQAAGGDGGTGTGEDQTAGKDQDVGGGEEAAEGPTDRVQVFVEGLSDEQVFALNRSLNNVVSSGLPVEYDMDLLQQIVEKNYDSRQINALTKAIEEEAKFLALYDKTGNEKFMEKAQSQKEKFLAKVDRFGTPDQTEGSVDGETTGLSGEVSLGSTDLVNKETARERTKTVSHGAAKETAKVSAKSAARESARGAAKHAALETAKRTAKEAAKLASRNAARETIKGTAKTAAKEMAREAKQEIKRQNKEDRTKKGNNGRGKG